ncbi:MAG: hypothetical protein Q9163_005533, partial [Psora crenata]
SSQYVGLKEDTRACGSLDSPDTMGVPMVRGGVGGGSFRKTVPALKTDISTGNYRYGGLQ